MNLETALMLLPGLVVGLTFHEAAHAISAKWLGDRTSERMGRISLNPMRHLSPLGTLALFFLGVGWGKPVEVNLYNFRKPKLYYLLTSLAGPVANLMTAAVALGLLYLPLGSFWWSMLFSVLLINFNLAVFNLLPIPPLDGSKIWPCLIPGMRPAITARWYMFWFVLLIVALQAGAVDKVLSTAMHLAMRMAPYPKVRMMPPEGFPEIITAPSDAITRIYWTEPEDSDDPNTCCTCFALREPYPAEETRNLLMARLAQAGWRKLDYLLTDPNSPGGNWTATESDTKGFVRHQWSEHWIDDQDQAVLLELAYETPPDEEPGNYLKATLWFYEASCTKDLLLAYRQAHPEELTDVTE
ncbi:MAG TPA: site-2 protease family protein [Anaerohalosphaeraceae bacterium]|jgi:Zn-dependent protease|nr:site-2 protease family protein [Anaerohalosphaeraceae bacterium]HRT48919.1 site-2 protease family protein [Anaerohalosphaeraceae bacterium]HRT85042.1 site-2 protease family protein [Anaerohalosphaeraceae bacterium]